MAIYWLNCIFTILLCSILMKTTQYSEERLFYPVLICGLPLFLLSALRYGIGTDYFEYVNMFQNYFSHGIRATIEPIFYYLNKFILFLNLDVQWVFVICSAIYLYPIIYYVLKESESPKFSIYLLVAMTFYLSSFNTIRQNIATSICLLSLMALKNNKYLTFIFCVLLASGFHYTSIVFLIMLIFKKLIIDPNKAIVLTGVFILCMPIITKLINYVLVYTRYAKYLNLVSFNVASIIGIALQVMILIFASIFYDKNDDDYVMYYNMQLITTCLTMLGNSISLIGRVKWIFALPSIVFIPLVFTKIRSKRNRLCFKICIILLFFVYAQVVVGIMGSYDVIPYKSILG